MESKAEAAREEDVTGRKNSGGRVLVSKASLILLVSCNTDDSLFVFILPIAYWSQEMIVLLANSAFEVHETEAEKRG